jgi:hypothetical protein
VRLPLSPLNFKKGEKLMSEKDLLIRNENESKYEHHKRLILGKLVDKSLSDEDYAELSSYVYGKPLSSDVCRREMYGSKYTIQLQEEDELIQKDKSAVSCDEEDFKYNYKNTIELKENGVQISDKLLRMSEEESKDVNHLLKAHGYDIKSWDLVSARNNIWNAYSKQDGIMTLYSSKITVKPSEQYKWNQEDIIKIFESLKLDNSDKVKITPKQYANNGKILVITPADFHYGLLSDDYSNGNEYNLEIAEKLFFEVMNDIIENNKDKKYEKVIFVAGHDMTNSDNLNSTTAKGTPQQDSAMWFTVVKNISRILETAIDMCAKIAPVDVIYVPSNHDLHTMFGVMLTLEARYRDMKNIMIDTSPLPRKYYKFGKNILAFSHDIKVKEALKIVSTEAKDMWSDSTRVILMLGHLHQAMAYEKQGMLETFRLPTISGYSRWTNTQGYVQTERKNQTFVVDYNKGIKEIQNTVLDL